MRQYCNILDSHALSMRLNDIMDISHYYYELIKSYVDPDRIQFSFRIVNPMLHEYSTSHAANCLTSLPRCAIGFTPLENRAAQKATARSIAFKRELRVRVNA